MTGFSLDGTIGNSDGFQPGWTVPFNTSIFTDAAVATLSTSVGTAPTPGLTPQSLLSLGTARAPVAVANQSVTYAPLNIIANFGTSITNLGSTGTTTTAEVEAAINAAINYYDTNWTSSVPVGTKVGGTVINTVNVKLDFGFGVLGTTTGTVTSLGQSNYNLAQVGNGSFSALTSAEGGVLKNLPATDPTNGGQFLETIAQLLMLGYTTDNAAVGEIGIGNTQSFDYNLSNQSISGEFGAVGVIEHEISEVFGREADLGAIKSNGTPTYSILDLYRFSSAGTAALTAGASDYFSLNGGTTALGYFNNQPANGGDAGDWASSGSLAVAADSYDAVLTSGTAGTISTVDKSLLSNIGFQPVCFLEGTRILTMTGERPIETLSVGDLVPTRFGGTRPVIWVGQRTMDLTRHPSAPNAWPVLVRQDAFSTGQPARDLYLSPDHAVFTDGMLIPVKLLINGATIQSAPRERVTYFHVELDRHDVLYADGLPTESYLDTGNRRWFSGPVTELFPAFDLPIARASGAAAPFVIRPDLVESVWRRLAARASAHGFKVPSPQVTRDPGLRLRAGDRIIRPVARSSRGVSFIIARHTGPWRLISRSGCVALTQPWVDDPRVLGVCVSRVVWHDQAGTHVIPIDHPGLKDGWWGVEGEPRAERRWTAGDAALPAMPGARRIDIELAGTIPYSSAGLPRSARAA